MGNPGFLSWVGYLLGLNTAFAKMVAYQEEMEEYQKQVDAYMADLPNKKGDHAGYEKDMADYNNNPPSEYQKQVDAFYHNHLGKLSAIFRGFRDGMPNRDDAALIKTTLEKEATFLAQQHAKTPLGKITSALQNTNTLLNYQNRTKQVVRHLLGDAADPNNLSEWMKVGAIPKNGYKPQPYDIPLSPNHEQLTPEQRMDYHKKMSTLAEIAGFAAVAQPDVAGTKLRDGFNAEESAQLQFGMILNDLFTKGRSAGQQHVYVLEPAREKAKQALYAFHANNPKPMAELLVRGLQYTNREARILEHLNKDHALNTLYLIGRLYEALNSDENLLQAAKEIMDPAELEEARDNMALYEVARQGQMAKQAILKHSLHQENLPEEQLLQAATDIIFANWVTRELQGSYQNTTTLVQQTQAHKDNVVILEAANKFTAFSLPLQQARELKDTKMVETFEADIAAMRREASIARGRNSMLDLQRPPHSINHDLRNPQWVKAFKQQIAQNMDLRSLISGSPEEIGERFCQDSKLMDMLNKASLNSQIAPAKQTELEIVIEEPNMENDPPEKNVPGLLQH